MDPERESLERHIAEVKRSLAARLDELGGRVHKARRVLEVGNYVRANPGVALGAAGALGFLLGHRRRSRGHEIVQRGGVGSSLFDSVVRTLVLAAAEAVFRTIRDQREEPAHPRFGSSSNRPSS